MVSGWASAEIAQPNIEGPIAVTAETGEPFRGASDQPVAGPGLPPPILVPYDFVEEEYFISGTVDGKPYKTSMLVRKPGDPAKFSGLVAVETIHAAGAIPFWGTGKVWLEGNHGWVAVASQRSALEGHSKRTNPERYASLNVPEADEGASQDAISQEIMTQVGALLKSNAANGPFQGMTAEYLLMGGSSQTGGTTLRYIQNSHEAARMPDGSPIFDGYAPWESFPPEPVFAKDSVIVHLVAEGDLMNALMRDRPRGIGEDRDGPDGGYRHYQVAGASHVGTRGPAADGLRAYGTLDNLGPDAVLSTFPQAEIFGPAYVFLIDWVTKGVAPPEEDPIEVENGEIVRDEHGIAKGGVRSPYVDLPTTRYIASTPPQGSLFGLEEPFPADKLRSMYKSREAYLKKFNSQIDKMVKAGWLFADEAENLKAEEAARELF